MLRIAPIGVSTSLSLDATLEASMDTLFDFIVVDIGGWVMIEDYPLEMSGTKRYGTTRTSHGQRRWVSHFIVFF